jgi:hypothetical protein
MQPHAPREQRPQLNQLLADAEPGARVHVRTQAMACLGGRHAVVAAVAHACPAHTQADECQRSSCTRTTRIAVLRSLPPGMRARTDAAAPSADAAAPSAGAMDEGAGVETGGGRSVCASVG